MKNLRKGLWSMLLIIFFASGANAQFDARRMYFVGNSLTDAMNYDGLEDVAESRAKNHFYGRQMIPGAPLFMLWDGRESSGFTEEPYGHPTHAFSVYSWDVLSLQPFMRGIEGDDGERKSIANFYNLMREKSPDVQLFIYCPWAGAPNDDLAQGTVQSYNEAWLRPNVIGNRTFYEELTTVIRNDYPASMNNIRMFPIGEIFYALNNNTAFLNAMGFSSIFGAFSDAIHLNKYGNYIVSCAMYAMAYHDDPAGLGVPGIFGSIPAEALPYIHQTIKDVLIAKSAYTGIEYFGAAPVKSVALNASAIELNVGKTATLLASIIPSNAANKNVNWTTSDSTIATVSVTGVVTAHTIGSVDIKVRTEDGGFESTCSITVTDSGVAVTGIILNKSEITLLVNTADTLLVSIQPENASNKNVFWASSDSLIAKVDAEGHVTAIKKGSAVISAMSVNGLFIATCNVTVTRTNNPPVAVLKYSPGKFGYAPLKIIFDGRSSSDPDPDDFVIGYNWAIKKQGASNNLYTSISNGFDYIFTEEGLYDVTLNVNDHDENLRSPNTEVVTIDVRRIPDVPDEETALCYEGFDYVREKIAGFNGGLGFRGPWEVQGLNVIFEKNFYIEDVNPIAYNNLRQSGNYYMLGADYFGNGRPMDISSTGAFKDYIANGKIGKPGTTLWFSVLIRPMNNNKECFISLSNESIAWLHNSAKSHLLGFGSYNDTKWGFAVGHETEAITHLSNVNVVNNTPAFLVAKIEFGTTNYISLFVNPEPGTAPNVTAITGTTTSSLLFQSISLNYGNGAQKMSVDEIRFGKTYADVAPKSIETSVYNVLADNISVYPVPATNEITIDFAHSISDATTSIVNVNGIAMIQENIKNSRSSIINIEKLKSGIYFIRISLLGEVKQYKFIKQ